MKKLKAIVVIKGAKFKRFGYEADLVDDCPPEKALPELLKMLAARCAARSDPEWVLREVAYMVDPDVGQRVDKIMDARPKTPGGILIGDRFKVAADG